jgi:hypothetical protein
MIKTNAMFWSFEMISQKKLTPPMQARNLKGRRRKQKESPNGAKNAIRFEFFSEDIRWITFAINMRDKDFLELLGLTNCILPNIIMSHALGTKGMRPINSTLVVIINRNGTH